MPFVQDAADSHVLARPRGRCREIRRQFRARVALAVLTALSVAAFVAQLGFEAV